MATKALSNTGLLNSNATFICYALLQRPSVKQTYYSVTALLFVMHGHKGPQPHRLITAEGHFLLLSMDTQALSHTVLLQHDGFFIFYARQRGPSATQADYSITALLYIMHGHKGHQSHRLITAQWHFYLLCMATSVLSHSG